MRYLSVVILLGLALMTSGCASFSKKSATDFIPKNCILTTNAVVKEVEDIEDKVGFTGHGKTPKEKRIGNVVVECELGKITFSSELIIPNENSDEVQKNVLPSPGQEMTLYFSKGVGLIGAKYGAEEYLKKKNSGK